MDNRGLRKCTTPVNSEDVKEATSFMLQSELRAALRHGPTGYAYPENKPFMITYSLRKGFEVTNSGPNENPGVVHC